jgi:hypothetical protein
VASQNSCRGKGVKAAGNFVGFFPFSFHVLLVNLWTGYMASWGLSSSEQGALKANTTCEKATAERVLSLRCVGCLSKRDKEDQALEDMGDGRRIKSGDQVISISHLRHSASLW